MEMIEAVFVVASKTFVTLLGAWIGLLWAMLVGGVVVLIPMGIYGYTQDRRRMQRSL